MKNLLLAAGILLATSVTASAADPEFVFKFQHQLGPKSPAQVRMIEPWAKKVEADSGGRIKIEIYPSMSLGGTPPQSYKQVADGVVDMTWTVNGYTPGLFPRTEVFELPNVFNGNIVATNLAMRELFDKYLAEDFKDVHVLFLHVHGGQAIQTASKEVRHPADMKGLKIRIPGPTGKAVVEALGAIPVGMPIPDLPQRLATHEVDGAMIPWEPIPAFKLQDFTEFNIEGPNRGRFGTTTFQVTMNKAKWDALPDDLKAVISKATGEEWLKEVGAIWAGSEDLGLKMALDGGNKHIILTDAEYAEFTKALDPVVQLWIDQHSKDFDAKGLVDAARAAIAKYSK